MEGDMIGQNPPSCLQLGRTYPFLRGQKVSAVPGAYPSHLFF